MTENDNWGLDERWEQFLLCVIAHMILPFLPLGFEYWTTNNISAESLSIATAMYALSIGVSSKISVITLLCGCVCLIFSFAYGNLVALSVDTSNASNQVITSLNGVDSIAFFCLLSIFIAHIIERYVRHIKFDESFFEFVSNRRQEEQ